MHVNMAEKLSSVSGMGVSNYLRFQLIALKSNELVSEMFVSEWNSRNKDLKWDDSDLSRSLFINGPGKELFEKSQQVQQEFMRSRSIKVWDMPLLCQALKCLKPNFPDIVFQQFGSLRNEIRECEELILKEGEDDIELLNVANMWMLQLCLPQKEIDEINSMQFKPVSVSIINTKAQKLKDSGNEAFKNGMYNEAKRFYTEAIALPDILNEEVAVLYSNRSVLKLGSISDAKEDAVASVYLCPTWWKGYYRLANVYKAEQKHQLALKHFLISRHLHNDPNTLDEEIDLCKRFLGHLKKDTHLGEQHYNYTQKDLEADMAYIFGLSCYRGIGEKRNLKKAVELFNKASAGENPQAMFYLAIMYANGDGVKRDTVFSIGLLKKAAERPRLYKVEGQLFASCGVAAAQYILGLINENGTGVLQDYENAAFWHERAIQNWCSFSANSMGMMYFNGQGVPKSSDFAVQYWKLGAAMGNDKSMLNLVKCYYQMKDYENMQRWYLYAAKNNCEPRSTAEYEKHFQKRIRQKFKLEEFTKTLWCDVENGPLKHLIDKEVKCLYNRDNFAKITLTELCSQKFNFD